MAWCGYTKDDATDGYQNENPVMVTYAYDLRFREFMKRFIDGGAELLGKVKHSWGRHESQDRAALHAHIAIWLEDPSTCKIRATVPRAESTTADGRELREKILGRQQHSCDGRPCRDHKEKDEKCKYGFPADRCSKDELVDARWVYRRSKKEDQRISPYHPLVSLAWGGHVNIQMVAHNDFVLYLCKYQAKANPIKRIKLTDELRADLGMGLSDDLQKHLCEHFLSIVISVPEAVMTLLGLNFVHFHSTTHSDPIRLPVILPHQQGQLFVRGQITDDLVSQYCCRPPGLVFDGLTFLEYHRQYRRGTKAQARQPGPEEEAVEEDEGEEDPVMDDHGMVIRKKRKPSVPVMDWLTPTDGERFYYSILLHKQPFRRVEELRSEVRVDFEKPYREQCFRKGFVESDEAAVEMALDDGARRGFTTTTLMSHRERLEEYLEAVKAADDNSDSEDEEGDGGEGDAYHMLPAILRSNEDATGFTDVVEDYVRRWQAARAAADVPQPEPTQSQGHALQFLLTKDEAREQVLMVMTGDGGCGKTWTTTAMVEKLVGRGRRVVMAAMTGVACDVYGDHVSTFDAVIGSAPSADCGSSLKPHHAKWHDLQRADYIIVDEASMMKGRQLSFLHDVLCRVMGPRHTGRSFAGKSIILVMDLYQLPPVDNRSRNVNFIYQSHFWPEFWLAELLECVRQGADPEYAALLRRLRKGEHTAADIELLRTREVQEGEYNWSSLPLSVPVIAPTNAKVDEVNNIRLENFGGEERVYVSKDRFAGKPTPGATTPSSFATDGQEVREAGVRKLMSKHTRLGHELRLKEGVPVMVLRNLNRREGVVNGALGTVVDMDDLTISIRSTKDAAKLWFVKRTSENVNFRNSAGVQKYAKRSMFPVRVAFAVTVHKVQGCTFDQIHVVMEGMWEDGQAYVALSRAKTLGGVTIHNLDETALKADSRIEEQLARLTRIPTDV
jgi:ATP-dependent DNA helicase PIF1